MSGETHGRFPASAARIRRGIEALARIGADPEGGVTRLAFSDEDIAARKEVMRMMREVGLHVRLDAAANIIGRLPGRRDDLAPVLTGSHIDTVPHGGNFDGMAGVVGAIEAVRILGEAGERQLRPIDVVVFVSEEPNAFGVSLLGSRAVAGNLPPDWLSRKSPDGSRTLATAWRRLGAVPGKIGEAYLGGGRPFAFLELHVEQGPVLERDGIPIGVVTGLPTIARLKITVTGRTDHVGTCPMDKRRDALVAASQVISAIDAICSRYSSQGVVGTVGRISVSPNQVNVVPGQAFLDVDLRSRTAAHMAALKRDIVRACKEVGKARRLKITVERQSEVSPMKFSRWIQALVARICQARDVKYLHLVSGAGHDAGQMAAITKAGMIFVPSRNGASHCPREWTDYSQVALGASVLAKALYILANRR